MKIISKKIRIIIYFLLITIGLSSCESANLPFNIKVYNKSSFANYGRIAMFADGKIYFEYLSKIFILETNDDSIKSVTKGKTNGNLFCVDNNLAYFIERKSKNIKISSSDILGNNIKHILDYKVGNRTIDYRNYFVENSILYDSFHDLLIYNNDGFSVITTKNSKTFWVSNELFTLYKGENQIFIKDKQHNISGLFDMNKNFFSPYNTGYSTILTYNKNSGNVYIHSNGNIYCTSGSTINNITKLVPEDSLLRNVFEFSEDDTYIYIVSQNEAKFDKEYVKYDELIRVTKSSGEVRSIYKALSNEHILFISSDYMIFYLRGVLYKKKISGISQVQQMKIFNVSDISIEFECSSNYLFAEKDEKLKIINLNIMQEILIP